MRAEFDFRFQAVPHLDWDPTAAEQMTRLELATSTLAR